jgi:type I restriction enzyme M protein
LIDGWSTSSPSIPSEPREVPIYGDEWLDDKGLTLAQAKKQIPNLQTYRKGAGEKIPDWELLERSIYGIEVSRQMMRISMMNLVLHGIRNAHVKRANALSELGGLSDDDLNAEIQGASCMNPPFRGDAADGFHPQGFADAIQEKRTALPGAGDGMPSRQAVGVR